MMNWAVVAGADILLLVVGVLVVAGVVEVGADDVACVEDAEGELFEDDFEEDDLKTFNIFFIEWVTHELNCTGGG